MTKWWRAEQLSGDQLVVLAATYKETVNELIDAYAERDSARATAVALERRNAYLLIVMQRVMSPNVVRAVVAAGDELIENVGRLSQEIDAVMASLPVESLILDATEAKP